jgi:hypothetical protein
MSIFKKIKEITFSNSLYLFGISVISWSLMYFFVFKFEWNSISVFWVRNWDKVFSSLGSIATSGALILTLYDISRRYDFEKTKFEFESAPLVKPIPLVFNEVDFIDYQAFKAQFNLGDHNEYIKEQYIRHHLITASQNIFKFRNFGSGVANNLVIKVSNSPDFSERNSMIDIDGSLASGMEYVFSLVHLTNL